MAISDSLALRPKLCHTWEGGQRRGKDQVHDFRNKPLFVPTLERYFQGDIDEITIQTSLDADITDDLSLGSARLIFQEEIVFEEREIR
jgi:hypothetical protein